MQNAASGAGSQDLAGSQARAALEQPPMDDDIWAVMGDVPRQSQVAKPPSAPQHEEPPTDDHIWAVMGDVKQSESAHPQKPQPARKEQPPTDDDIWAVMGDVPQLAPKATSQGELGKDTRHGDTLVRGQGGCAQRARSASACTRRVRRRSNGKHVSRLCQLGVGRT